MKYDILEDRLKSKKPEYRWYSGFYVGGERGIRTPGPLTRSTVFKTAAFDHSAISPNAVAKVENIFNLQ